MEYSRWKHFFRGLLAVVALCGIHACHQGAHLSEAAESDPGSTVHLKAEPEIAAEKTLETQGCESSDLLKDPLCQFVVLRSEAFMVFNGQTIKIVATNEYDKRGNRIAVRMALPASPEKYFATVSTSFSELDGLKYAEEWMMDYNQDGKFDYRIVTTWEYEEGKVLKEITTTYNLALNKPVFATSKKYDYTQPGIVEWIGGDTNYFTNQFTSRTQQEKVNAQGQVEYRVLKYQTLKNGSPEHRIVSKFKFGANGQVEASSTMHFELFKNGVSKAADWQTVEYSYDESARLVLTEHLNEVPQNNGTVWKARTIESRNFDETGNLAYAKHELDNGDDGQVDIATEWTYKYDEFNNNTSLTMSYQNSIAELKNEYRRLFDLLDQTEPQVALQ